MASVRNLITEIEQRGFESGVDSLSPDERMLFVAWQGTAIISNGGFYRFFREGGDIDALAAAYRTLGLAACSAACLKSKTLFPRSHPFSDGEKTGAFLKSRWRKINEAFEKIEDPIYDLGLGFEGLQTATVNYLKQRGKRGR